MTLGKKSKAYEEIRATIKPLLEGVVCCFDPSIGSTSSMPGWAVSRAGVIFASGIFEIPAHETIPQRLNRLHGHVRKLYNLHSPDVCVYEQIPALRQGGGNAWGHASLLKALGVILSVPGPADYVAIFPMSWKSLARDEYVKGDEADAIEILWVVIEEARRIREYDPPGRRVGIPKTPRERDPPGQKRRTGSRRIAG